MAVENPGCIASLIPVLKVVSQSQVMVIERLGKFHRLAESGVNMLIPFLDRPRTFTYRFIEEHPDGQVRVTTRTSAYIDLREQVLDFPRQSVITSDNVVMEINAILYYRVIDPVKAIYQVANFADAIEKLTQTTLRNVVGEMTLDQTLSSRDQINARLLATLDVATNTWGVDVTRVELQDIIPPADIRQTMELQMTAERRKRAQLLDAEANKTSAILTSEGEAEARIREARSRKEAAVLAAQGEAEAVRALAGGQAEARRLSAEAEAAALDSIAKVVGKDAAIQYAIGLKYLQSLEKMADGQASKTFIPYEAAGALGAVGALREMFNDQEKQS
ncbi:MAG: paraslipin [Chloroflexi bacterium]|nr:paraslipin [Chloroflexota bacterium]MCI0579040.1 paraslipin [Chloroflexota bacterium]MCI0646967.1 paraslipin [Chloroflexota bacterium]MCI0729274.1 paraslipin [Chloroflexota bacterium]